ncbi:UDP-N-acetylmuramate dehydrogenase [Peribacillus asahii]|uniref:UDP-N-acetylmuramate dehydrogenase n=1 Tax=Peribacillus asahii TaxID=228899 RepID=UPI000FDC7AC4|nr:UDP-N-acetylmuramate dehydrogenase [Peribacillus asahii]USK61953.1 UDP-N-acetylmuramate dehydrogenase [Peribacillus asahii]USK87265.1 UDP-N-acetylmuramate dehydrogenase [Peribacillus asahii]
MEAIVQQLRDLQVGKVLVNEPLANHTTMKMGGPADLFIEPSSIENLEKTMKIIRENNVPWRAIGRGSNLLVSDAGIEGALIKLGKGLDHLEINESEIRVGAGYSLVSLSVQISKKGLAGLEFASGIPGSVGGSVYMNAGAHGSDMSEILEKAYVLFADGTLAWLSKEEMEFSYRTSILQKKRPGIVLEAIFQLTPGNREEIVAKMQSNKNYRKETQPYNLPCAGSIFRNPLPHYAGQLVQEAGLKGYSIGGAQISPMHGNFIVNTGNGKAADVLALIQYVKDTVFKQYGIMMETEVEIIGRK